MKIRYALALVALAVGLAAQPAAFAGQGRGEWRGDQGSHSDRRYDGDRRSDDRRWDNRRYDDRRHEDRRYDGRRWNDHRWDYRRHDDRRHGDRRYDGRGYYGGRYYTPPRYYAPPRGRAYGFYDRRGRWCVEDRWGRVSCSVPYYGHRYRDSGYYGYDDDFFGELILGFRF